MQIRSVGIDLGKTTFHLVALSAAVPASSPSIPRVTVFGLSSSQ
jgi:hypothetical protein